MRLGVELAREDGSIILHHDLSEVTRITYDKRVPSGGAQLVFVTLPASLPAGTAALDAVLYYRNIRTRYYRAATGDPSATSPEVEVARARVP